MYRKLDSDLQTGKNRLEELTEQSNALKKGREESVSDNIKQKVIYEKYLPFGHECLLHSRKNERKP